MRWTPIRRSRFGFGGVGGVESLSLCVYVGGRGYLAAVRECVRRVGALASVWGSPSALCRGCSDSNIKGEGRATAPTESADWFQFLLFAGMEVLKSPVHVIALARPAPPPPRHRAVILFLFCFYYFHDGRTFPKNAQLTCLNRPKDLTPKERP